MQSIYASSLKITNMSLLHLTERRNLKLTDERIFQLYSFFSIPELAFLLSTSEYTIYKSIEKYKKNNNNEISLNTIYTPAENFDFSQPGIVTPNVFKVKIKYKRKFRILKNSFKIKLNNIDNPIPFNDFVSKMESTSLKILMDKYEKEIIKNYENLNNSTFETAGIYIGYYIYSKAGFLIKTGLIPSSCLYTHFDLTCTQFLILNSSDNFSDPYSALSKTCFLYLMKLIDHGLEPQLML